MRKAHKERTAILAHVHKTNKDEGAGSMQRKHTNVVLELESDLYDRKRVGLIVIVMITVL